MFSVAAIINNFMLCAGLFAVKSNQLIVASGTKLNYEEEREYTVVVMVTDNGTPPLSYKVNHNHLTNGVVDG